MRLPVCCQVCKDTRPSSARHEDHTISDWDARRYDLFGDHRQRPARDLLAGITDAAPETVTDLGCGTGLSTELLTARWPNAQISGTDSSPGMLQRARERLPGVAFRHEDIADFEVTVPQSLLFANASLQWLPNHRELLPKLLRLVADGGHFALQMPDNLAEPSHALMRDIASYPRYRKAMEIPLRSREPLLTPGEYYDCLTQAGAEVSLWQTRYLHALDSASAIVDWFATTALKPYLDALDATAGEDFRRDYLREIEGAYPRQADGRVLLAMPRLFLIAKRRH